MQYFASIMVVASALLFKWMSLNIKQLQEKGMSAWGALYCHRFAIAPAFLLTAITFRREYLELIFSNYLLVLTLLFVLVFWILRNYISYFTLKSVNSLSFLKAFESIIALPIFVVTGILINKDVPNLFIALALVFLAIALLIKPSPHKLGVKRTFRHHLALIILITFIVVVLDAIDNGLYRFFLQNMNSVLFAIGLCAFLSMLSVWVVSCFRKLPPKEIAVIKQNQSLAYSIAPLWFLGSIPEGYAFFNVSIYTFIAIASFNFIIDVFSDLRNKRIHLDKRTLIFIALVLLSIGFSVWSLD